jgi:hypothetical protein
MRVKVVYQLLLVRSLVDETTRSQYISDSPEERTLRRSSHLFANSTARVSRITVTLI